MTDEHEKLTAEYERLVKALDGPTLDPTETCVEAIRHILYRLGPPDPMDGADAAMRAALEAQTSGA